MAVDPEKAIEKLSQYREESKSQKKLEYSEGTPEKTRDTVFRKFFIHMYKFNAIVAATLGFVVLMTLGSPYGNWLLWIPLLVLSFGISFQIMRTIKRLNESDGRKTTVDDVFIVLVLMLAFFGYYPVLPFSFQMFQIIHVGMVVVWFIQIFMVNYNKPEMTGTGKKGGITETDEITGMANKISAFFTKDRVILLLISFAFSIPIVVLQYSS